MLTGIGWAIGGYALWRRS